MTTVYTWQQREIRSCEFVHKFSVDDTNIPCRPQDLEFLKWLIALASPVNHEEPTEKSYRRT
jgi:hypothetical protein